MIQLNPEQKTAADAIYGEIHRTVFRGAAAPKETGRVIALIGGQGCGKSEIIRDIARRLVAEKARRDQEALEAMRQSFGGRPEAEEPRARPSASTPFFDDELEQDANRYGFNWGDANASPRPRRKTRAEMRAEEKAKAETEAFDDLDSFTFTFEEA